MITKKALRASAKARKAGATKCDYLDLLFQGERAYLADRPLQSNPHTDPEDAATWRDGWLDAMENLHS